MTNISYKTLQAKDIYFIIALLILGFLSLRLFLPYLNIIALAFIIVQIFYPFYEFIYRRSKSKSLATLLSVIIAIIIVLTTFIILGLLTYSEFKSFLEGNGLNELLHKSQDFINSIIGTLDGLFKRFNLDIYISPLNLANVNYGDVVKNLIEKSRKDNVDLPQQVISAGAGVVYNTFFVAGDVLFNFFMLLFSMIYLFPNYNALPKYFNRISPLDSSVNHIIYDQFIRTVKGAIKGTFLVAIIQASVMIVPLILLGVGAPVFLWILMVIVSIIPIGSGLIWGPVATLIILNGISSGNPTQTILGILLIVYGAIMVNIIDAPLRSRLIKDTIDIHPMLTIFSILGGLLFFGFFGILYGPLIVVVFTSMIEIFKKQDIHEKIS